MVSAAVTRLDPGQPLVADGYIRVSRKAQAEGHSPQLQREAIQRLAAQEGYVLGVIEEDHERGSKIDRKGYQKIVKRVENGIAHAVIVYMFDRWGRDGVEWLDRARAFDRLGVPIISVQEGKDEGGLMRFVRAGMAQWYSEQLALRVRPAREKAAREGKHMGVTPFGFKRVYPAHEGSGRYVAGVLVEDEATSWAVKELFALYAAGGWSIRRLAARLNGAPDRYPRGPRGGDWTGGRVEYILKNPVYRGEVRYNTHRVGKYETSAPGSAFVTTGQHSGFIAPDLFDTVRCRLAAANKRPVYNRLAHHVPMAAHLLVCAQCRGPMIPSRTHRLGSNGQYRCLSHTNGQSTCTARSYTLTVAHAAILAEVKRLRGAPWRPQALAHMVDDTAGQTLRATLTTDLAREHKRREQNSRLLGRIDDPTDDEIAEFRRVGAQISAAIKALEAHLAAVPTPTVSLPDLEALHARLTRTEVADAVDALVAAGDEEGLRELVTPLVESARIVDRVPARNTRWARAEVTWTADIATLLDAGLLSLAPAAARPQQLTLQERTARNYRLRKARRAAASTAAAAR